MYEDIFKLYNTSTGKYYLPQSITNDIVIDTIKDNRVFDEEVINAAKPYIRINTTVLDVGACFGQMSVIFSSLVGETGNVLSFEASPYIFNILQKNIEINHCKNVKLYSDAVYDNSLKMVTYPLPDFSRFESYGSYGISIQDSYGYKLNTLTIDSLDIQQEISFMKIDIQGSDLFAMRGAVNTIKKYKMPIIFEYEELFQGEFCTSRLDYENFIYSIGYEVKDIIITSGINYLIIPK